MILITSFGAFGNIDENPSTAVAIAACKILENAGIEAVHTQLPVAYRQVRPLLTGLLDQHQPQLVICIGVAATRQQITLEAQAHNQISSSALDIEGWRPISEPEMKWRGSHFAVAEAATQLQQQGYPVAVSRDAGGYVCNYTLWTLLDLLQDRNCSGVFVHVPLPQRLSVATGAQVVSQLAQQQNWWRCEPITPVAPVSLSSRLYD